MAVTVRVGPNLLRLVDKTNPAAQRPAIDVSAATPRGTKTKRGKNRKAAASRPRSHQAATTGAERRGRNRRIGAAASGEAAAFVATVG
jgi:hypothetical protein